MLIHMARPAPSAMDWNALYAHLAKLRADLENVKRRTPVNVTRYRTLRQQIAECITEISRYHQRAAEDQNAPPNRATPRGSQGPSRGGA